MKTYRSTAIAELLSSFNANTALINDKWPLYSHKGIEMQHELPKPLPMIVKLITFQRWTKAADWSAYSHKWHTNFVGKIINDRARRREESISNLWLLDVRNCVHQQRSCRPFRNNNFVGKFSVFRTRD